MTVPTAALVAAAEACPFVNHDALLRALEAAAHLIAAATVDPTTENEGFRAYKAGLAAGREEGAAAERDRIRQLARQHAADCTESFNGCCIEHVIDDLLPEGEP